MPLGGTDNPKIWSWPMDYSRVWNKVITQCNIKQKDQTQWKASHKVGLQKTQVFL